MLFFYLKTLLRILRLFAANYSFIFVLIRAINSLGFISAPSLLTTFHDPVRSGGRVGLKRSLAPGNRQQPFIRPKPFQYLLQTLQCERARKDGNDSEQYQRQPALPWPDDLKGQGRMIWF